MRDCLRNRGGFDRVLMAVAATFLTVSATSAMAQSDPARGSAAELAIDAAIPRPEPANLPPPNASDFKTDTTASVPQPTKDTSSRADAIKTPDAADTKPADLATAPNTQPSDTSKNDAAKTDNSALPSTPAAAAPMAPAGQPAQEPVKAASSVPVGDQPVADKIRELLAGKTLHYFDRRSERAAVEKFYGAHDFAPLWTQSGGLTANAKGAIARLKDAASDGLNPDDYAVPDFAVATTPDALAEADLKLTNSVLDYARQAQSGRMHYSQVSGDIQYPEHPTDPTEVLTNVTTAKDASTALDSYNPPQKLYRELKRKLADLRGGSDVAMLRIGDGPVLKYTPSHNKKQPAVAMEDSRVPQLRVKLGIAENADDDHYDAKVADAVEKFQENADLKPTGILDERTVAALNSPKRDKQIDTVIVNMERWRWLPRDLGAPAIGDAYVILNIPDYTLKVMQHGAQVWTTRVVAGKPGIHATPLLSETMKFITVNPTWNVPPSIIYNEYLPALQQDPTVLERMGLKLDRARDGSIHISQPPGEANALGRVRFNFPNKFLVYQHDTPDKYLFEKSERAFSHGCMRVQYPDQYASVLLNITLPSEHYTPEKIRSMYGSSEIDLKFPTPIPVNITYQTAFVDDAGKLQIRRDVYGRDAIMIAMLKGAHGKDLENVVAHAQPSYSRPAGSTLPPGVSFASENTMSSGPSFFERLFGGPPTPPAPIGRRPSRGVFTR
jgi:L,D-transpeptidase YcbB